MIYSIVNFLATLINGALIVTALALIDLVQPLPDKTVTDFLAFFQLGPVPRQQLPYLYACLIMSAFVFLSLSPPVDHLIRFCYGFRRPLRDERNRLHALFREVALAAHKKPDDFQLYVTDDVRPDVYSVGDDSLAVSRTLLKNFSDTQIQGILAHELGHLHHGDGAQTRSFIVVNILGQIALLICRRIIHFFKNLGLAELPFLDLVAVVGHMLFRLQFWLIQLLLVLPLAVGAICGVRANEYRADRYAAELGFQSGLYDYLAALLNEKKEQPSGFLALIHRVIHPGIGKRLYKLEKWEERQAANLAERQTVPGQEA